MWCIRNGVLYNRIEKSTTCINCRLYDCLLAGFLQNISYWNLLLNNFSGHIFNINILAIQNFKCRATQWFDNYIFQNNVFALFPVLNLIKVNFIQLLVNQYYTI